MAKKDSPNWRRVLLDALGTLIKTVGLRKLAGWLGFSLSGFQGWIARWLVEHAFEKIITPAIDLAIDTGRLHYDKRKGELVAKDIWDAKNDTELRRALNDLK